MFRDSSGKSCLLPFILVASLFFLWGVAHSILDVLNKHFQDVLVISKARSGLVQAMVYGGYFLMALPAGKIIRKWGYRAGIVTGLLLYGIGALMFIPGGRMMSFPFFLLCLFVIGCGLTCLETSANPYITVLGDRHGAARRLNLAQSQANQNRYLIDQLRPCPTPAYITCNPWGTQQPYGSCCQATCC